MSQVQSLLRLAFDGGGSILGEEEGGILHDIANVEHRDWLRAKTFSFQVLDRRLCRAKEEVAYIIGKDAVDLFRHLHIETAQASFDVRDGNVQFDGSQRAGQCRVCVAIHKNPIGFFVENDAFDAFQHTGCHLPVGSAMDVQLKTRLWYAQLVKENAGHVRVEVLAGVEKHFLYFIRPFARA